MNGQKLYSCIVLSGGMSRRMGQDKGSMIIQEKPMILHILERLNYKINIVMVKLKRILIIHWNLLRMKLKERVLYQES